MSLSHLDKESADKLKNRAATASIALAFALSLLKLLATALSGSLAVLSSMIDSLSDVLGSGITYIAVKYSARPATKAHRYGYGKAEAVSALIQALFVAGSGLFVVYDAIMRFKHPRIIEDTPLAIGIMAISLISTLLLISYQKHVAKLTQSQAILADSAHYVVDILTNLLTAFAIALYLLWNAYQLAKTALATLLDHELSEEVRSNIQNIIAKHDFVQGFHDLRTRDSGNDYLVEIHLELDGNLSLFEAHRLSDIIESDILKEYPNAQIIIHQDPAGICEDRLDTKLVK